MTLNKNVSYFFEKLCEKITENLHQNDLVRCIIFHPSLETFKPISIPFYEVKDFDPDLMTNLFLSINQSKRSLKIDEDFQIYA